MSRFIGPRGPQGPAGVGPLTQCPPDEVLVGPTCVDKYEASVWQIDPSNATLVAKVKAGTVTLADLTSAGASPLCATPGTEDFPPTFPASGQWTALPGTNPPSPGVYAVSVAGEWQDAAAGTPDPGTDDGATDCAVTWENGFVPTGPRAKCVSAWGAYDMVGNAGEWVADWGDQANDCSDWTAMAGTVVGGGDRMPGHDSMCFGGSGRLPDDLTDLRAIPGPLLRGVAGDVATGSLYALHSGVFAVTSHTLPFFGNGFRCGR